MCAHGHTHTHTHINMLEQMGGINSWIGRLYYKDVTFH